MCAKSLQSCPTLWPYGKWRTRLLCPWDSLDKNTAVGCHALLWGIFLIQGQNSCLLHCRQVLYRLSNLGSLKCYQYLSALLLSLANVIHFWIPLSMTWGTFAHSQFCFPASVSSAQFSSVQSLSHVWLFATPRIAAHQASLSITKLLLIVMANTYIYDTNRNVVSVHIH